MSILSKRRDCFDMVKQRHNKLIPIIFIIQYVCMNFNKKKQSSNNKSPRVVDAK